MVKWVFDLVKHVGIATKNNLSLQYQNLLVNAHYKFVLFLVFYTVSDSERNYGAARFYYKK